MPSITRYTGDYKITLNDVVGIITRSPKVTQLFFEATAHVVTRVVAGTIREIVVTIDSEIKQARLVIHQQTVQLNIAKLEMTVQEYYEAIERARRSHYPAEFERKLEQALRLQLERELEQLLR